MTVDERYKELYGDSPFSPVEEAIEEIQAGRMVVVVDSPDRENEGDLVMAADVRHRRRDQLHGDARPRPDLPDADAGALRGARPADDDAAQQDAATRPPSPSRSRPATASRPGSPPPTAPTRSGWRSIPAPAPRTWSSPGTCSRCGPVRTACSSAPARPRRRSTWPGWPGSAPPAVICEVMNDDGTMARIPDLVSLLPDPRAEDDHRRRPHRLPPPPREAGASGSRAPACPPGTASSRARLPLDDRRPAARRAGDGGRGRRPGRAGARPLRVPHRRRLPLAALRLRRAARAGAGADRRRRAAASCCTWRRRAAASAC